jgi:hypothetical protein
MNSVKILAISRMMEIAMMVDLDHPVIIANTALIAPIVALESF